MVSQQKALDFVAGIRKIQDLQHSKAVVHSVPEWIIIAHRQLVKAENAWYEGRNTDALHRLGHVAACGVAALEQLGTDQT